MCYKHFGTHYYCRFSISDRKCLPGVNTEERRVVARPDFNRPISLNVFAYGWGTDGKCCVNKVRNPKKDYCSSEYPLIKGTNVLYLQYFEVAGSQQIHLISIHLYLWQGAQYGKDTSPGLTLLCSSTAALVRKCFPSSSNDLCGTFCPRSLQLGAPVVTWARLSNFQ